MAGNVPWGHTFFSFLSGKAKVHPRLSTVAHAGCGRAGASPVRPDAGVFDPPRELVVEGGDGVVAVRHGEGEDGRIGA